jgi:hypothetical protein
MAVKASRIAGDVAITPPTRPPYRSITQVLALATMPAMRHDTTTIGVDAATIGELQTNSNRVWCARCENFLGIFCNLQAICFFDNLRFSESFSGRLPFEMSDFPEMQ